MLFTQQFSINMVVGSKMTKKVYQTKSIQIYSTQIKCMEAILQYVDLGYIYWTSGVVKRAEAKEKLDYFIQHYNILDSKDQRYYKKKSGKSNHQLILFNPFFTDSEELSYILLASDGESIFFRAEKYKNTLKKGQRIDFNNYELAQYKNTYRDEVCWSWRLNDRTFNEFKNCIIDAIRHAHHNNLRKLMNELSRLRGYNLVRQQYLELLKITSHEIKTKHGKSSNIESVIHQKVKDSLPYTKFSVDIVNLTFADFLKGTKPKIKKSKLISELPDSNIAEPMPAAPKETKIITPQKEQNP